MEDVGMVKQTWRTSGGRREGGGRKRSNGSRARTTRVGAWRKRMNMRVGEEEQKEKVSSHVEKTERGDTRVGEGNEVVWSE